MDKYNNDEEKNEYEDSFNTMLQAIKNQDIKE